MKIEIVKFFLYWTKILFFPKLSNIKEMLENIKEMLENVMV